MIPLLGIYLKKSKTLVQKNISTPMFIAALFTIAKDKTTMGPLHNGILLSSRKEEKFTLCNSIDGPGEHYAK